MTLSEHTIRGTCWRCADLQVQLREVTEERDRLERVNVGLRHANKWLVGQTEGLYHVGLSLLRGLEAERGAAIKEAAKWHLQATADARRAKWVSTDRDLVAQEASNQRTRAEAAERRVGELETGLGFYAYEGNHDFIGERDCKCGAFSLKGGCWRECYCAAPADDEGEYARTVLAEAQEGEGND